MFSLFKRCFPDAILWVFFLLIDGIIFKERKRLVAILSETQKVLKLHQMASNHILPFRGLGPRLGSTRTLWWQWWWQHHDLDKPLRQPLSATRVAEKQSLTKQVETIADARNSETNAATANQQRGRAGADEVAQERILRWWQGWQQHWVLLYNFIKHRKMDQQQKEHLPSFCASHIDTTTSLDNQNERHQWRYADDATPERPVNHVTQIELARPDHL